MTDWYQQAPGTTVEEDEVGAAVRVTNDEWLVMNPTAVAVWRTLKQRSTVDDVVTTLGETYIANTEEMRQDVVKCLREWRIRGLVICERA